VEKYRLTFLIGAPSNLKKLYETQLKWPRYYRFVDSIPLTATGKKMHCVVKAQAGLDFAAGLLIAP